MNQNHSEGGKRLRPGMSTGAKLLILLAVVSTALFAGYAAFCAWVGEEERIPNDVTVALQPGGELVSVGDMSIQQAEETLSRAIQADENYTLTVNCGDQKLTVDSGVLVPDTEALDDVIKQLNDMIEPPPFFTRGINYLKEKFGVSNSDANPVQIPLTCTYQCGEDGDKQVSQLLEQLSEKVTAAPVAATYQVGEESIEVTVGSPGVSVDLQQAKQAVLTALQEGRTSLTVPTNPVPVEPLKAEALNQEVYVQPEPAKVDSNGKTTPQKAGTSIDVDSAQAALDAASPGQTVSIPLVRTQPKYTPTQAKGVLYRNLLSQCVTSIGGSSSRLGNVTLAAKKCNEVILQPGDVFDYNKVVGQRTQAKGFQSAPAYVAGATVNEIGGGICQVSSSLYYCAVYANLKIVTRYNHMFAVGYVPDGLDATVSWGGPEFRFRNNTEYPIKIVTSVSGRTLTVSFYGTNPNGTYVTTERTQLSATSATTEYKPDASIPRGTTKVSVTPYNGRKVEVYRCVHSADGKVLSRTLENISTYRTRNKVVLYNPADAGTLGINAESQPPVESQTPEENEPPVESLPPEENVPPVESQTPEESVPPVESQTPEESVPPVESQTPEESVPPVENQPPEENVPPAESQAPTESEPPVESLPPVENVPPIESLPPVESVPPIESLSQSQSEPPLLGD